MGKKIWVDTCDECFVCGEIMKVYTEAKQDELCESGNSEDDYSNCEENHIYHAIDGDLVKCPDCGAIGWISCDSESDCYVAYDETTEHNLKCVKECKRREETLRLRCPLLPGSVAKAKKRGGKK